MMVPARPILDTLIESDGGRSLKNIHKTEVGRMMQAGLCGLLYPDIAHLSPEQIQNFLCEVEIVQGKAHLAIVAPKGPLQHAEIDRLSNAGTSIVAGLAYAPREIAHTREAVQSILINADVINGSAETEDLSIVFQGGARISNYEYKFAKLVGAEIAKFPHAPKKFITGGGRGIMRAPHRGSQITAMERGENDTTNCGVSCGKIIAAEPPNSIVTKLAVFEQIERRLEAFTRSGQLTVFFPGGTGTFEELLYVLAVLTEPKNQGIHYTFLLAGSEENLEYYDTVISTLEQSLGTDIVEQTQLKERVCIGKPEEVAQRILKEAEASRWARRKEITGKPNDAHVRMDFHGGIHIPKGLRVPFLVTRESVAALQLHREQSAADIIVNLRRFLYSVSCACISKERDEVAQNGPFVVSGDPEVMAGIDRLLEFFVAMQRMNGGTYQKPYILRGAA